MDEFGVCVDEGAGSGPEGGEGAGVVEDVHVEAVFHVVVAHEAEDVVVDVAEEVDLSGKECQSVVCFPYVRVCLHQVPPASTNRIPLVLGVCRKSRCSSDTCAGN